MSVNRLLNGTVFLLWSVVAQRVTALVGDKLANDILSDLRQFLSGQGFSQLAMLVEDPAARRQANAILNQACDLFDQRITNDQLTHLRRFSKLPLRTIEELELALSAFVEIPSIITLERVVSRTLEELLLEDVVGRLHLEEARSLFMDCMELALVSQGDMATLLLKIEALRADVKQLLQPVPTSTIESDELLVAPEALVGREMLIQELMAALDPDSNGSEQVIILYGPLGVGKSAIALEVGRRLQAAYSGETQRFDAVIFDRFQFHDKEAKLYEHFIQYLETKLGVKTSVDHIEARAARVRNELRQRSLLFIVDEVEHDIAQRVVEFTKYRAPQRVKVLITQNTSPQNADCQIMEIKALNNPILVREFISSRCKELTLTDSHVERILKSTQGNLIALEEIARLFNSEDADIALSHIAENLSRPGNRVAERWIGYTLRQLSRLELLILYAQCIFQRSAHVHMLIDIVRAHETGEVPEKAFRRAIKTLGDRGLLNSDGGPDRYSLRSTFQNYIRQQLKDNNELDSWRISWKDQYVKLRKREEDFDDTPGWTILIDYTPTGRFRVNPSHPDEAETIRDVIHYCTSPNRIVERWEDAARLLDNFRATLFAAGHWQTRIDAERRVIGQAERLQEWHYLAQHKRLLAWMYCFRDEHVFARQEVEQAYKIVCEHLPRSRKQVERLVHCQTMYKALITLGHIALREGHHAAIQGHYQRISDSEYAEGQFRSARDRFSESRFYFKNAQQFIRHAYPDEELIVTFHLAEVEYYDRYSLTFLGDSRIRFERLELVRTHFASVLEVAIQRNHMRLTALTTYYLGKTYRRLATYRSLNADSEVHFAEARRLLDQAFSLAAQYGDNVLLARIAFAYGQYYESLIPANEGRDDERRTALERAREQVQKSVNAFESIKMQLEKKDAQRFLEQRLSIVD
jgi:hypothetical protein